MLKRCATVAVTVLTIGSIVMAGAQAATAPKIATVTASSTGAGTVIANSTGHVLFMFTRDKHGKDSCKAIKLCETDWPPLTTTGPPKAAKGVRQSLLGTIPYKGKLREVTYDHHPLHTYKFDDGAALSFTFIGIKQFGGAWYGLSPSGKIVKQG